MGETLRMYKKTKGVSSDGREVELRNGGKERPPAVGSCCVQGNETVRSLLVIKFILKKSFPNITQKLLQNYPITRILPGASGEDHGIFFTCSA